MKIGPNLESYISKICMIDKKTFFKNFDILFPNHKYTSFKELLQPIFEICGRLIMYQEKYKSQFQIKKEEQKKELKSSKYCKNSNHPNPKHYTISLLK